MTDQELYDRFAGNASCREIAAMSDEVIERQVAELIADGGDAYGMTAHEIAQAIRRYAGLPGNRDVAWMDYPEGSIEAAIYIALDTPGTIIVRNDDGTYSHVAPGARYVPREERLLVIDWSLDVTNPEVYDLTNPEDVDSLVQSYAELLGL